MVVRGIRLRRTGCGVGGSEDFAAEFAGEDRGDKEGGTGEVRELEMRKESEFQVELTEVVTEGKLRIQSEGAKRVEREREEKDQRIRQQLWEARNPQKQKRTNGTSSTPLKEVEKTGGGDGSTRSEENGVGG